jgi:hypothetical protein
VSKNIHLKRVPGQHTSTLPSSAPRQRRERPLLSTDPRSARRSNRQRFTQQGPAAESGVSSISMPEISPSLILTTAPTAARGIHHRNGATKCAALSQSKPWRCPRIGSLPSQSSNTDSRASTSTGRQVRPPGTGHRRLSSKRPTGWKIAIESSSGARNCMQVLHWMRPSPG